MQKAMRKEKLVIPLLHGQQGMAYEDQEKAETFADTLETEGRLNTHPDEDDQREAEVMQTITDLDMQNPSNKTPMVITPRDTRIIFRRLQKQFMTFASVSASIQMNINQKNRSHVIRIICQILFFFQKKFKSGRISQNIEKSYLKKFFQMLFLVHMQNFSCLG